MPARKPLLPADAAAFVRGVPLQRHPPSPRGLRLPRPLLQLLPMGKPASGSRLTFPARFTSG